MFFSILIPVYNTEKYLREALDSAIHQTVGDYEIVVADDGSGDGSAYICDEYEKLFPDKVRVFHKANEGLLLTRRRLISSARGQYFVFLDADDRLAEDALMQIKRAIESTRADVVLYDYTKSNIGGESKAGTLPFNDGEIFFEDGKTRIYNMMLTTSFLNNMWLKAVSRSIVDIDTDYSMYAHVVMGEDKLQSYPLFDASKMMVYIKRPLYWYRKNSASITGTRRLQYYDSLRTLCIFEDDFINRWHVTDKIVNQARIRRIDSLCSLINIAHESARTSGDRKIFDAFIDALSKDDYWLKLFDSLEGVKFKRIYRDYLNMMRRGSKSMLYYYISCAKILLELKRIWRRV